ncbi:hypothetical protein FHT77_003356 [Rhizobium sp. BK181]|uniref:hypothetical protein n=1 Tax=Rhizobium sp. BK181 TaxID=2587072 RepID=UPI00161DF6D0|nr:hypothetical protein [Rhizobium sp. BK181]MBB3317467.1 hypothetical protein [Rhizobium sp. BK181]
MKDWLRRSTQEEIAPVVVAGFQGIFSNVYTSRLTCAAWALLRIFPFSIAAITFGRSAAEDSGDNTRISDLERRVDGMQKRRLIRILVSFSKTICFIDRGEQSGSA